jgi:uncharacterized protein YfbU (UPF0304 family)
VNLTKFERIVVAELLEIRALLDPNSAERLQKRVEALWNGYPGHYGFECYTDELSKETTSFVHDVLDMYLYIQFAFSAVEASEPDEKDVPRDALFPGFAANSQERLYGYACFLRKNHQYDHVLTGSNDVNSHGAEPDYRSMLAEFAKTAESRSSTGRRLSIEEATIVLAAGLPSV